MYSFIFDILSVWCCYASSSSSTQHKDFILLLSPGLRNPSLRGTIVQPENLTVGH